LSPRPSLNPSTLTNHIATAPFYNSRTRPPDYVAFLDLLPLSSCRLVFVLARVSPGSCLSSRSSRGDGNRPSSRARRTPIRRRRRPSSPSTSMCLRTLPLTPWPAHLPAGGKTTGRESSRPTGGEVPWPPAALTLVCLVRHKTCHLCLTLASLESPAAYLTSHIRLPMPTQWSSCRDLTATTALRRLGARGRSTPCMGLDSRRMSHSRARRSSGCRPMSQ
jgi:hypothetical protein